MVLLPGDDGVGRCPGMSPVFVQRTRLAAQLQPRSPKDGGSCLPLCRFGESAMSDGNLSCSKPTAPMREWQEGRREEGREGRVAVPQDFQDFWKRRWER